jgi:hypothetical protein
MGEAKRRAAARANEHAMIDAALRGFGIDTSQFGFYDQPAFMAQEARDPAFLEQYARWVQSRPRTHAYDERTRRIVPRLAKLLADLFEREGMQRSCVHASSMMPRILDRLGVWSFGIKGSFVSMVPSLDLWRGQAIQDIPDFPGAELGHAWIVAPPFFIVDPTIRLQNPPGDAMNQFTPPILAIEDAPLIRPTVDDVVSAQLRAQFALSEGRADSQLHHRLEPTLKRFGRDFPSRETRLGELVVRYVPAGVRVSDLPLEQINGADDRLTGAQVWLDHVAPAFAQDIVS